MDQNPKNGSKSKKWIKIQKMDLWILPCKPETDTVQLIVVHYAWQELGWLWHHWCYEYETFWTSIQWWQIDPWTQKTWLPKRKRVGPQNHAQTWSVTCPNPRRTFCNTNDWKFPWWRHKVNLRNLVLLWKNWAKIGRPKLDLISILNWILSQYVEAFVRT